MHNSTYFIAAYLVVGALLGYMITGPSGLLTGSIAGLLLVIANQLNRIIENLDLAQRRTDSEKTSE
ncbi:hypothetical protein [Domibacillus robiginosus]|uniref:hypothetical protein n=1 Tax=Domibacillus robiginosus TaxID=1071054 RepID=UPI00067D13A9|nr:hypothetical protein [Domibacillus robiginosus]